jgi:hypothetical protein
LAPRACSS